MLELESLSKGLLMVRIPLVETTNPAPLQNHVAGMTVYNTQTLNDVEAGNMYYNDGTKWLKICTTCGQETSPCITPSPATITPTNASIAEGDSLFFIMTGGIPNTGVSWSISPATGVSSTSGTGISTGAITFDSLGVYTIDFITTNNNTPNGCSPGESIASSTTIIVTSSSLLPCTSIDLNTSVTTTPDYTVSIPVSRGGGPFSFGCSVLDPVPWFDGGQYVDIAFTSPQTSVTYTYWGADFGDQISILVNGLPYTVTSANTICPSALFGGCFAYTCIPLNYSGNVITNTDPSGFGANAIDLTISGVPGGIVSFRATQASATSGHGAGYITINCP